MSNVEVAIPEGGAFAQLMNAQTPMERFQAGQWAVEAVKVPGFKAPVPRFMFDLPWAQSNEETVTQILANLAAADDIEKATADKELRSPEEIAGQPVTVLDVVCRPSDVDDAKWGAYMSLMCTVAGAPPEVINTGAGQVAVTMWRCYCQGLLPVTGTFKLLGTPTKGRSQPVGFSVESSF
jgi:hypothetical protein